MNCKECGKPLPQQTGKGRRKSFCDKHCSYRFRYPMGDIACKRCGKKIVGHKRKFCDEVCRHMFQVENYVSKRRFETKHCPNCDIEFEPVNPWQRYCSTPCRGKHKYKNRLNVKETFTCKHCRISFIPRLSDRTTFCCREHHFAYKTELAKAREIIADIRKRMRTIACPGCKQLHLVGKRNRKWCTDRCEAYHRNQQNVADYHANPWYVPVPEKEYKCSVCKKVFPSTRTRTQGIMRSCSPQCRDILIEWQRKLAKRLREGRLLASHEPYNPMDVFKRDGWRCHLCGATTSRQMKFPHPRYATLDHVLPLSKGGADAPGNVKCCCFDCNSRKSDNESWKPSQAA